MKPSEYNDNSTDSGRRKIRGVAYQGSGIRNVLSVTTTYNDYILHFVSHNSA